MTDCQSGVSICVKICEIQVEIQPGFF